MWPLSSPRWPSGCEPRPPRSQPTGMPGGRYGPSCGSATSRRARCQATPSRPSAGADAPWSGRRSPREQAEAWDADLGQVCRARTSSPRNYRAIDDGVFGGLAAGKPSIYPIYWSRPQMQARQDDRMAAVRRFLNSFWKHESEGRVWFDPDRDTAYPDRVRRRAPGSELQADCPRTPTPARSSAGCSRPISSVFRHVYSGNWTGVRPLGRGLPHRSARVRIDRHVLGVPQLPGLDRAVGDAAEPGRAAYGPDPRARWPISCCAPCRTTSPATTCAAPSTASPLPITERYHAVLLPALTPDPCR